MLSVMAVGDYVIYCGYRQVDINIEIKWGTTQECNGGCTCVEGPESDNFSEVV